jgi:hypothetical protein
MSFPFTYNRFLPVWLKNTNAITSTQSGGVSLQNDGKTELVQDASLLGNVGVRKPPNASYSLDVSGNLNFTGNITKNGVLFDGNFVTLNTTQTITGTKAMNNLLPLYSLNNTTYRIGTNSMLNQQADSSFNIVFGTNAMLGNPAITPYLPSVRNIAIGESAGSGIKQSCDDNVLIGYEAMRNAFTIAKQNVYIGNFVAKNQNTGSRNTFIGYNCGGSAGSAGDNTDCVVIGANSCQTLAGRSQVVIVGAGNGNSASSVGNSWTVVGSLNCINGTQGNQLAICGNRNIQNSTVDFFSLALGNQNGNAQTTGYYNIYIGLQNNLATSSIFNSATIGVLSIIPRSNCLYLGASRTAVSSEVYQNVCIAFKNTLLCVLNVSTATLNIAFEDAETIVITSNTTTVINLPTPSTASATIRNVGTRFTLLKSYTTPVAITINAPAGQTIRQVDGSTSASYTWSANQQYLEVVCIANSGTSWGIINSQLLTTAVLLTGSQSISGVKTFLSPPIMSGASITSNTIPIGSIVNGGNIMLDNANETISGIYTFSTPPVMSGASITSNTIPISSIVNGGNLVRNDTNATITGTYTFSTNPIFSNNSINPNYITYMISENTIQQYAFGEYCLFQKTAGATQNNAFGQEVMSATGSTSGTFQGSANCGFGTYSMYQSETALGNACYGNNSGFMLQNNYNSSFGHSSMFNSDGSFNTICGFNSGTNPFVTGPIILKSCSALGSNTYFYGGEDHITLIGADSERDPGAHPDNNAIILGRFATDDTYVGKDLYVYNSIRTNTISPLSGTTISISNIETTTINGTNIGTLNVGNPTFTTNLNGTTTISGAQKINGYSTLSGSPNNLTKPLSSYYQLTTATNGALTLPVIDSTMYGSQIVFTKISTDAIWTINAGAGNTFRLYKSNSTATATSISLSYNNTTVRIVATQTSVWEVIDQDSMYDAVNQFIIGRQYFPYKINPTIIAATTNWNTSFPAEFYGIQRISITANSTLTLPLSTDSRVPPNMRIKFRRVGGTTTTTFGLIASTGDTILAVNSTTSVSAGTASTILASGVYQVEVILNGTQWIVMF